ncbi:MAG: hypothetical protein ACLR4Z_00165 [Butyricicoccaceae bacterium]
MLCRQTNVLNNYLDILPVAINPNNLRLAVSRQTVNDAHAGAGIIFVFEETFRSRQRLALSFASLSQKIFSRIMFLWEHCSGWLPAAIQQHPGSGTALLHHLQSSLLYL